MNTSRIIINEKERGVALLVAMLALLLLAAIGIGFMFMADTENSVNNNYRSSQKGYFASRAGLENVRALLARNATNNTYYNKALALDMPSAGSTGWLYILNPTGTETVNPSSGPYGDDQFCQEQYGSGQNTAFTTTFSAPSAGVRCDPASITITSAVQMGADHQQAELHGIFGRCDAFGDLYRGWEHKLRFSSLLRRH